MASNHTKSLFKDYDRIALQLEQAMLVIEAQNKTITFLKDEIVEMKSILSKKDEQIEKLTLEIERLKNNNDKDSSNSSSPSSKDNLKKVHNSREKSNKKKGGQKGHEGTTSEAEKVKELIDTGKVKHVIVEINKTNINQNSEYKIRYIQDIEIVTVVREYRYYPDESGLYNIPKEYSNVVTYGNEIKSIGTMMVHRIPASMDQCVTFFKAITNGSFNITKSTLVNWTNNFAEKIEPVMSRIEQSLYNSYYVNTDESPININGKNHYLHSYSNETLTLQYIHARKSKEAIEEIGFLPNYLGTLVHDHNTVQYNYGTRHSECNAHILRYLKAVEDFTPHKWPVEMSALLKQMLHEKHLLIEKNKSAFDEKSLEGYSQKYSDILSSGLKEHLLDCKTNAFRNDEKKLINRLVKYKKNHLLFMYDFKIPFTNNRAEADIRPAKRKLNVGIFRSVNGARYYLRIRSFLSTLLKNNADIFAEITNVFSCKSISFHFSK